MSAIVLPGFTVRPAAFDDFEAVLDLIVGQNTTDYGEPMISARDLRQRWQSPKLNLALDTWVVVAPDGRLAGYAELEQDSSSQFVPSIYVVPEYPAMVVGPRLLQLAEERAVLSCSEKCLDLICRVSEQNRAGQQILEAAGYRRGLSFLIMEIIMSGPPRSPQWAPGITVRPFVPGQDEQATYLADEEASADKGYHEPMTFDAWARRMSLYQDYFDPALWFLAGDEDKIAGVALNIYSPASETGWIDHLGVRRPWRRRGIGTALLLHSLAEFYRRGIVRVRLSVDSRSLTNATRLYEQAGMHTIQQYHIFSKELHLEGHNVASG